MTDKELKELVAENSRQIGELSREVKQTTRQIGELGNKFGRFTEGLFAPSLEKILLKEFGLDEVAFRVKSAKGGGSLELGALGIANGRKNEAVVVEVKSRLRDADLDEFLETLRLFPRFFPQHKDKKLYGIIASVGTSPEQQRRAEKLGLGVVEISDETFRLKSKRGFAPKDFRPVNR